MEKTDPTPARTGLAPRLPDTLAMLYAPIVKQLKKINIRRRGERDFNPRDILLPEGYTAELVASGINAPTHCTFAPDGTCYVAESGHKIEVPPRILKVDVNSGEWEPVLELPAERWVKTGAITGVLWHREILYFMNTDRLSQVGPLGQIIDVVTGLPGRGDHQSNYPVAGPDGKLYFGQGCATNCGVVGADNFAFEWLSKNPEMCDVPAQDITLVGRNYEYRNVLEDITQTVHSGAYSPFGVETRPGQVIPGSVKASGAVLRCNPDGSELEVVAWGLRNPYGIAFHPDGRLFVTEHGMDERGQRYIFDDPDDFYEIQQGEWYGWPDYASGIRLDDPHWSGGRGREPVIANPPNPNPPRPLASFETHTAANGFDFSRSAAFGFEGDAFVALFGDLAPITTLKHAAVPAGFKVVRVDPKTGRIYDFAVNKIAGPAARLPHSGFERPSHCQFGPDGALYVVDYGIIHIAPEKGGIRMQEGTGALWRIRRTGEQAGRVPPNPLVVPVYLFQYLATLLGIIGLVVLVRLIVKWVKRNT